MNFLDRVENLRKSKSLTVKEALNLIGVSAAMMSMIRNGKRQPGVKTLRKLQQLEEECGLANPKKERKPEKAGINPIPINQERYTVKLLESMQAACVEAKDFQAAESIQNLIDIKQSGEG